MKNIIVSHNGALGDTMMALPSLWALRETFPDANICYLYEKIPNSQYIQAREILKNTGLVDRFQAYVSHKHKVVRFFFISLLFFKLRKYKWDLAIVLQEKHWSNRKKKFFQLCGARMVLGPDGDESRNPRNKDGNLVQIQNMAKSLLDVLRPLGDTIPRADEGRMELPISNEDISCVDKFLQEGECLTRPKIAVAPWSNMPLKRWPLARYLETVEKLIHDFNIIPIVMGGSEERYIGETLVEHWGRGLVSSGQLNVKQGVELLSRCHLFLGNDSGTMHMAACAGVPCVAIFSARDNPGRWEPHGKGHVVFRKHVPCEGCMLRECSSHRMKCIMDISVDEVIEACSNILQSKKDVYLQTYPGKGYSD